MSRIFLFFIFTSLSSVFSQNIDIDEILKYQRERFKQFDQRMQKMMEGFNKGPAFGSLINGRDENFIKNIEEKDLGEKVQVVLLVEDLKNLKLTIKIENRLIEVSANINKKEKLPGGGESIFSSSSSRVFSLPEEASEKGYDTKIKDNKIIITFIKETKKTKKYKIKGGINI